MDAKMYRQLLPLLRAVLLAWAFCALAACGSAEPGPEEIGQLVFEDPVDTHDDGSDSGAVRTEWLGLGPDGTLVWFEGQSGRIVASAALVGGAGTRVHDVAYDPTRRRAVALQAAPGRLELGSIVAYPMRLGEPAFGAAHPVGQAWWSRGLWPVRSGVVVFERGPTPQWRLVDEAGSTRAREQRPPPLELWGRAGSARFDAAVRHPVRVGGSMSWLEVAVAGQGFTSSAHASLEAPPSALPASARLAPHGDGVLAAWEAAGELVLGVHGREGELRRTHAIDAASPPVVAMRLLASPRSPRARYALLLAEPARLCVVQLGDRLQSAVVELRGAETVRHDPYGRVLVTQRGRAWVATTQGVVALDVLDGPEGLELVVDDSFRGGDLRGPLAGPVAVDGSEAGR